MTLTHHAIQTHARQLGFDHCRIVPLAEAAHADFFDAWIEAGRAGEMHYLKQYRDRRRNPALLLGNPQSTLRTPQSLIVLAINYHQFDLPPNILNDPSRGIIAAYAWGNDYHAIVRPLLYQLDGFIRSHSGRTTYAKCLVDTGPVLERDWAMKSGIGFTGKNCCTIHPTDGSWLLLATMVIPEDCGLRMTDYGTQWVNPMISAVDVLNGLPNDGNYGTWEIAIEPSSTLESTIHNPQSTIRNSHATCGKCTRCLDDCPTQAFVGPFHLDPLRCISYWTIESQAAIPRDLRPLFTNRIFGCDICQEVCPWNKRRPERRPLITGLAAQEGRIAPLLLEGFQSATPYWIDPTAFDVRFQHSPIQRATRHGMARNVCVALGNWADPCTIPALTITLHDPYSVVRGHAAWALGQVLRKHRSDEASQLLQQAQIEENDDSVREEIAIAQNL